MSKRILSADIERQLALDTEEAIGVLEERGIPSDPESLLEVVNERCTDHLTSRAALVVLTAWRIRRGIREVQPDAVFRATNELRNFVFDLRLMLRFPQYQQRLPAEPFFSGTASASGPSRGEIAIGLEHKLKAGEGGKKNQGRDKPAKATIRRIMQEFDISDFGSLIKKMEWLCEDDEGREYAHDLFESLSSPIPWRPMEIDGEACKVSCEDRKGGKQQITFDNIRKKLIPALLKERASRPR